MQPVTCYTTQARLVPYTTYRLVYSNPCAVGMATTGYYGVSSCNGCTPGATYTAPAYAAPAYSTPLYPAPSAGAPSTTVPSLSTPGATTPIPRLVPTPGSSSAPRTFQNGQQQGSGTGTETRMQPIPDADADTKEGPKLNPTSVPRLIDPENRTATAWPAPAAWSYSRLSWPARAELRTASTVTEQPSAPVRKARRSVDADGWRPSNR
jgi:hypothetical protein